MAVTGTASLTIAEMREFAGLSAAEQRYIRRSLDIGLGRCDAFRVWGRNPGENAAIRSQYVAYQELKALRQSIPEHSGFDSVEGFVGKLTAVLAAVQLRQMVAVAVPDLVPADLHRGGHLLVLDRERFVGKGELTYLFDHR